MHIVREISPCFSAFPTYLFDIRQFSILAIAIFLPNIRPFNHRLLFRFFIRRLFQLFRIHQFLHLRVPNRPLIHSIFAMYVFNFGFLSLLTITGYILNICS